MMISNIALLSCNKIVSNCFYLYTSQLRYSYLGLPLDCCLKTFHLRLARIKGNRQIKIRLSAPFIVRQTGFVCNHVFR